METKSIMELNQELGALLNGGTVLNGCEKMDFEFEKNDEELYAREAEGLLAQNGD